MSAGVFKRNLIAFLLACTFAFLPLFEMDGLADPTVSGKFLGFGVILLICLPIVLFNPQQFTKIKINRIDIAIGILLIYITVNRYLIQENHGFSIVYYELLGLSVLYFILTQLSISIFLLLFFACITGCLVQCLYGYLQLLNILKSNHGIFRLTGSFFNPGPFAGYISSSFPIALGLYMYRERLSKTAFRSKEKCWKFICFIAGTTTIAFFLLILSTHSRAAWLATAGATCFLLWSSPRLRERLAGLNLKIKRSDVYLYAGMVLLGILLCFALFFFKKDSASGRIFIWKITTQMIAKHPVFGVGIDRFKAYYMDEQASYFRNTEDQTTIDTADNIIYAFNEPLQFTAENGIPALILLCWLIYLLLKKSRNGQKNQVLMSIVRAAIIGIGIFSLCSYPSVILPIKLNLVLFLAFISKYSCDRPFLINSPVTKKYRWPMFMLGLLFSLPVLIQLLKWHGAYKNWGTALHSYESGNYREARDYYEKAYPVLNDEGEFLINYGKALSMNDAHKAAIKILTRASVLQNNTVIQTSLGDSKRLTGAYQEAEQHYMNAQYMIPSRLYPQYLLIKLYQEAGLNDKALHLSESFLKAQPKVESLAVEQMKIEISNFLKDHKKNGNNK